MHSDGKGHTKLQHSSFSPRTDIISSSGSPPPATPPAAQAARPASPGAIGTDPPDPPPPRPASPRQQAGGGCRGKPPQTDRRCPRSSVVGVQGPAPRPCHQPYITRTEAPAGAGRPTAAVGAALRRRRRRRRRRTGLSQQPAGACQNDSGVTAVDPEQV